MATNESRPSDTPRWATVPTTNATSGQSNTQEPTEAKKDLGWDYLEKPARNWFNWILKTVYDWVIYFRDQLDFGFKEHHFSGWVSGFAVSDGGGLDVDIALGQVWVDGIRYNGVATTLTLPNNTTSYLYFNAANGGSVQQTTVVSTAVGMGSAYTENALLAWVVTSAGVITSIQMVNRSVAPVSSQITVGGSGMFGNLADALAYHQVVGGAVASFQPEIVISGTITIPAKITLSAPVTIRGLGTNATLEWSFADNMIEIAAQALGSIIENIEFERITNDGAFNVIQSSGAANDVTIRNCRFIASKDFASAVSIQHGCNHWRIEHCYFADGSGTNQIQSNCVHVNHASADQIAVENCTMIGNANAISRGIGFLGGTSHIARGNTIESYEVGIESNINRCLIIGNNIKESQYGIRLLGANWNQVIGNYIDNIDKNGIIIDDSNHNLVSGNFVYLAGQAADATYYDLILTNGSSSCSVVGNITRNTTGAGFTIKYSVYALDGTGNTDNNLISGNDLQDGTDNGNNGNAIQIDAGPVGTVGLPTTASVQESNRQIAGS